MTYRPADFRFTEEDCEALEWAVEFSLQWEAWELECGWTYARPYDQDEEA